MEFFSVLENIENWPFYDQKTKTPLSFGISALTLLIIILWINVAYFWNRLLRIFRCIRQSHQSFFRYVFVFVGSLILEIKKNRWPDIIISKQVKIFEFGSLEVYEGGAQGLHWIASLHVCTYVCPFKNPAFEPGSFNSKIRILSKYIVHHQSSNVMSKLQRFSYF